jgi:hypothetical protein
MANGSTIWDALNRLVGMNPKAGNPDNRLYSFVYRADGLRVKKVWHTPIEVAPAEAVASGPSKVRTEEEEAKPVYIGHEVDYLYDGQMPVCEQEFEDGVYFAHHAGKLFRCAGDRGGGDGRPFSSMLPPISYREKLS